MGFLCNDDKPYALSTSNIGSISKCDCCDSYHVTIGNITLRMERKYLITLTQMIIEGLEVNSILQRDYENGHTRNQA